MITVEPWGRYWLIRCDGAPIMTCVVFPRWL